MNRIVIFDTQPVLQQVVQHKRSKRFVKVLLRVQKHLFGIVVKKWTFWKALCDIFSQKICIFMLTECNWPKKLQPNDHIHRREFVVWIMKQVDFVLSNKIIFSDEIHLQFDGLYFLIALYLMVSGLHVFSCYG